MRQAYIGYLMRRFGGWGYRRDSDGCGHALCGRGWRACGFRWRHHGWDAWVRGGGRHWRGGRYWRHGRSGFGRRRYRRRLWRGGRHLHERYLRGHRRGRHLGWCRSGCGCGGSRDLLGRGSFLGFYELRRGSGTFREARIRVVRSFFGVVCRNVVGHNHRRRRSLASRHCARPTQDRQL